MPVWQPVAFRIYGPQPPNQIRIEERLQADKTSLWVITDGFGMNLLKDGTGWIFEPVPSSRDDAFIQMTRWATWQEAMQFFEEWSKEHG